jgi:putative transposase
MSSPERKTARMRWARVSIPGARYFLTLCTQNRVGVLMQEKTADDVRAALHTLQSFGDAEVLAAALMPDHLHVLFTLGERLSVGQVMAKLKTLARDKGRASWHWQQDGFEHRLRPDEAIEDYGFYIFINPYRARLLLMTEAWPGWICPEPARFRFTAHLIPSGAPPAEWLEQSDQVAARITTGSV